MEGLQGVVMDFEQLGEILAPYSDVVLAVAKLEDIFLQNLLVSGRTMRGP